MLASWVTWGWRSGMPAHPGCCTRPPSFASCGPPHRCPRASRPPAACAAPGGRSRTQPLQSTNGRKVKGPMDARVHRCCMHAPPFPSQPPQAHCPPSHLPSVSRPPSLLTRDGHHHALPRRDPQRPLAAPVPGQDCQQPARRTQAGPGQGLAGARRGQVHSRQLAAQWFVKDGKHGLRGAQDGAAQVWAVARRAKGKATGPSSSAAVQFVLANPMASQQACPPTQVGQQPCAGTARAARRQGVQQQHACRRHAPAATTLRRRTGAQ